MLVRNDIRVISAIRGYSPCLYSASLRPPRFCVNPSDDFVRIRSRHLRFALAGAKLNSQPLHVPVVRALTQETFAPIPAATCRKVNLRSLALPDIARHWPVASARM